MLFAPIIYSVPKFPIFYKLADAISEARSKHPESWITIGGDWNNRDLTPVLSLFPDLSPVDSGPTRKNATLDIQMTNYTDHVRVVSVNHALETLDGRLSDHKILQIDSVLPRPKSFSWEVHEYLKTSKEGDAKLLSLLGERVWGSVAILAPNVDDMTVEFHRVLDELMLQCYSWNG